MIATSTETPWWVIASIPVFCLVGMALLCGPGDCLRSPRRRDPWAKEEEEIDDEELKAEIAEMRRLRDRLKRE